MRGKVGKVCRSLWLVVYCLQCVGDLTSILSILSPLDAVLVHHRCPFVVAAYVDIVNLIISKALLSRDCRTFG